MKKHMRLYDIIYIDVLKRVRTKMTFAGSRLQAYKNSLKDKRVYEVVKIQERTL